MNLWMSGETEADLADAYRIARNAIEPVVNRALEGIEFNEVAENWTLIPVILSSAFLAGFPEIAKRSSKGSVLEFRLQIPHAQFKQASAEKQMALLFDTLSRSIDLMPKLKVSPESQDKFRAALAKARASLLPG